MWQCPDPLGKTLKNRGVFYPLDSVFSAKYKPTLFLIRSHFARIFRFEYAKLKFCSKYFLISVTGLGASRVSWHKTIPCNYFKACMMRRREGEKRGQSLSRNNNSETFRKIHIKHLRRSYILNEFPHCRRTALLNETTLQVFFCEFCNIHRNNFFREHIWVAASDCIITCTGNFNLFFFKP